MNTDKAIIDSSLSTAHMNNGILTSSPSSINEVAHLLAAHHSSRYDLKSIMATSSILWLLLAVAVADATTITVVNRCSYTVWPGSLPRGGARLDPGQSWAINVPAGTAGARIWPRTGCSFDGSGRGRCITGDCAGALVCAVSGEQPATLAEYTLGQGGSRDFFDLSLIDGFNVPVSFQPVGGACRAATCAVDITAQCLPELRVAGGCASACGKFGGDVYCCRGQFEHNCPPTDYSRFFKNKCPDAYSYAKDDQTSTFTCPAGTNYQVVFCPANGLITEKSEYAGVSASA